MRPELAAFMAIAMGVMGSGAAMAHHSFAMFDQEHPKELTGTVTEFRYSSPHIYIYLNVKESDGTSQVWNLEGGSPSLLIREGWSSKSIKPGDELQMTIDPLRSGEPGGAWQVTRIKFKDGRPIAVKK